MTSHLTPDELSRLCDAGLTPEQIQTIEEIISDRHDNYMDELSHLEDVIQQ